MYNSILTMAYSKPFHQKTTSSIKIFRTESKAFHHTHPVSSFSTQPPNYQSSSSSSKFPSGTIPFTCSSKLIPSFVPSNRTLELRISKDHPGLSSSSSSSIRFRPILNENNYQPTSQLNRPNSHSIQFHSNSPPPPLKQDHSDPINQIREKFDNTLLLNSVSRREDNWSIRCIEIDQNGEIIGSCSMSKGEICAQNRLQPRDLRKIDSRISNVVPSILVRDEAIIFNVLNIRALIKADSILLFQDPHSPSLSSHYSSERTSSTTGDHHHPPQHHYSIQSAFLHNLLNNLRDHPHDQIHDKSSQKGTELPYEFRALETMLGSVAKTLESELAVLKTLVSNLLDGLKQNIEREELEQLLLYSRQLSAFNGRALLVQRCLDEILENEQDMANSYLSEKILKNKPRQHDDHEEFEQLLESFSKYVEEIVHEGTSLLMLINQIKQANIKSTEEIIDLILDSNRNNLLALELKVSIGTMGLSVGAFSAALFGMNLRSHMEQDAHAFYIVTGSLVVAVGVSIGYGCRRLYRLRRVGLSSTSSVVHHQQTGLFRRLPWSSPTGSRIYPNPPESKKLPSTGGILDWDLSIPNPGPNPPSLLPFSRWFNRLRGRC